MSDQNPAPGWYPAPYANDEQRYWDGTQWIEPEQAAAPAEPGATMVATKPSRTLGIVALVGGIVAFLTGLVPVLGAIVGVAAVVLGILALLKKQPKGFAITGMVLGIVALITSIAVTAGLANFSNSIALPEPSASSVPSETPSADPTEEPAAEPSEEPSEAPVEEPAAPTVPRQDFSGTGDTVIPVNVTEAAIISFSCGDCTRNTVVKVNSAESLLVNAIGAYSGSHLVNINVGSVVTQITIEATGNWSLIVADVTTAPYVDTTATGSGDSVLIFTGDMSAAALTHDGSSNFVIKVYGDGNFSPLAVNTIGAYSGTVEMSAPAVVQVIADGNWSITGQ